MNYCQFNEKHLLHVPYDWNFSLGRERSMSSLSTFRCCSSWTQLTNYKLYCSSTMHNHSKTSVNRTFLKKLRVHHIVSTVCHHLLHSAVTTMFGTQGDGRERQGPPISLWSCENLFHLTSNGLPLGLSSSLSPVFSTKGMILRLLGNDSCLLQTPPEC